MNLISALLSAGWIVMALVVIVGIWRIAVGPSTLDRLIGFDTVVIGIVSAVLLFSIAEGTDEYLELVLVITALGFVTTVCYFYYLSSRSDVKADLKEDEP